MKGFLIKGLMFALMIAFGSGNAFAEPSAKVTCNVTGIKAFDNSQGESLLFSNTIKTAEQKELFIDVSLESGLTTNTKVVSKSLQRAISEAYAMVEVSVTVDGKMAQPGWVTFARRSQALIAKFAGDITGCLDGEGHLI